MGISKAILKWTDKEMDKVMDDDNQKRACLKALGLGAIEGIIDGAVLAYPILVAGCIYWRNKAIKK